MIRKFQVTYEIAVGDDAYADIDHVSSEEIALEILDVIEREWDYSIRVRTLTNAQWTTEWTP